MRLAARIRGYAATRLRALSSAPTAATPWNRLGVNWNAAAFIWGGPLTLLQDSFVDVNGTNLATHPMSVGPGWTIQMSTWFIQNNRAQVNVLTTRGLAVAQAAPGNTTVTCDVYPGAGNDDGVLFRGSDANNYWFADVSQISQIFQLFKVVAGVVTGPIGTTSALTVTAGAKYSVKVVLNGININATVNGGNPIASTADAFNQAATLHGLKADSAAATFGNFLATKP